MERRTHATHPHGPEAGMGECTLKVASYNIHLGIGRDGVFKPERIASVIAELDADVISLQEVARTSDGFDMLAYLSQASGYHGIPGPTLVTARGDYGNAMLTRLAPGEIERWDISVPRREPRGAIAMMVHKGGWSLRMIATHLGLWPGERRRQIRKLLGLMQQAGSIPTVLMGDVNEWFLWGRPLRWLHRHFLQTPGPATFPSNWPVFALDRIWVEPRRALQQVAAHRSAVARLASDHLPITATIRFAAEAKENP
ncbi:MAG TPA: endonuclease/exonuclease/phosphatase family protein [Burkholderiales bacterium]